MAEGLGTYEELPEAYRHAMSDVGVTPLWPMLRNLLPHGSPHSVTQSAHWRFADIKPLLIEAGELAPVEKAERRVLVLSDPGRGPNAMQATGSIYVGMQLLLPGEVAPAHRHTPSAARIIIEGSGGFTVVNGEKLPMEEGDLVLTPGGQWHDHGHEGDAPVIWLDALDLPVFTALEASFAEDSPPQLPKNRPDSSDVEYLTAGVVPVRQAGTGPIAYPMMRFQWRRTEAALRAMAQYSGNDPIEVDYVNPETGGEILPVIGFSALMVQPGKTARMPLRSSSAVYHVVRGSGQAKIDNEMVHWSSKDTFSVPGFAELDFTADQEDAFLICIHDRPIQQKVGYYREQAR